MQDNKTIRIKQLNTIVIFLFQHIRYFLNIIHPHVLKSVNVWLKT